jgi:hypothetical protein
MIIKIDQQHAAAGARLIRPSSDCRVVEDTKAHSTGGFGVMSGRTDECEDRSVALNRRLDRRDCAAGGTARDVESAPINHNVASREIAWPGKIADLALDQLDISVLVDALDLTIGSVVSAIQIIRQSALIQTRSDHLHAVG